MPSHPIVYCLTRDRELAAALDGRLTAATAFFYNDAARLHQAVTLRAPDVVLVDTGAVRAEYGDAGLGPVFEFVRRQAPRARLAVRAASHTHALVLAEAGPDVGIVPHELDGCVAAMLTAAEASRMPA